jgi:hypothetical protein
MRRGKRLAALATVALGSITGWAVAAEIAAPAAAAAAPAPPCSPAIEIVKALAWPVFALLIAGAFRRPLALFVGALGSRVTKLSLFKVELELVPAAAAAAMPLLDDIRTATSSAALNDSSSMMLEQVQSGTAADFAVIDLGDGEEWLTSRLYIAAVMMERMRSLQVFVFVERTRSSERRLVAVASVRQLRWALARRYPWIEAAWVRALLGIFPSAYPPNAPALPAGALWPPDPRTLAMPQQVIVSDTGAFEPWRARDLVRIFIDSLQRERPAAGSSSAAGKNETPVSPGAGPAAQPDPDAKDWITLRGKTQERAAWVTHELLRSLLPQEAFDAWVERLRDAPRAQRTRAILRRPAPFVALTEGDREFVRLANRQALLEEIAATLAEEPETAAR